MVAGAVQAHAKSTLAELAAHPRAVAHGRTPAIARDNVVDSAESLVRRALSSHVELLHQRCPADVADGFEKLVLDLVKAQLVVLAPRNQLELPVIHAVAVDAPSASPEKFFGLVGAMSRKDGYGLDGTIHGGLWVGALVEEEEIAGFGLRHGQQPMPKGRMASSPHGEVGADYSLGNLIVLGVVPELDAFVEGTSHETVGFCAVPVDAVDFGRVGTDGLEGLGGPPDVPDVKPAVMGRGQDEWILAVVLDLGGAGEPVAEGEHGLPRSPEIPTVDIAIHGAGRKRVRVVGREVDVGDGAAVGLKGVLDSAR